MGALSSAGDIFWLVSNLHMVDSILMSFVLTIVRIMVGDSPKPNNTYELHPLLI